MKRLVSAMGATLLALGLGQTAHAEELRIGFVAPMTGSAGLLGRDAVNGWKIGLEHEGWKEDGDKLGGVPLRMFYADDQLKADVAIQRVERLITQDHIDIGAGFLFANVILAARGPMFRSKRIMLSTLSGPRIMAGKECSPYFISTSWAGEQTARAAGALLNHDNVKTLYVMAPDYQGGRETLTGLAATYKGKMIGQSLFRLGEKDFQAEIAKVRATKPQALLFFGPGAMGISFMKQWVASGAGKQVKLYTHYVIDSMSLAAIGDAAIGSYFVNSWPISSAGQPNRRFIKDFVARFGHMPSYVAAQAYDGPRLIAAALRATHGKFDDPALLMKAMRHTPYPSSRGYLGYNVNGFPIVNFYKQEVVRNAAGKLAIVTRGTVVRKSKDPFSQQCPASNRL